jgi:NADP-dependent 3-hydroxy acid dehydrogenase YdfG
MLNPDGRVIMVSGANRGIGLATAQALAKLGYTLSLGTRAPERMPMDGLDGAMIHHWDATKAATSAEWASATQQRFGRIDGVVMNAGVELGGALEGENDEDAFNQMWDVNFMGPLRLVRATLPALRACGQGRVINVVSLAGKRVRSDKILGYSASKHAANALTHAIRMSGWEDGVRATSICPGLVETDMTAHATAPAGSFKIAPDAIAQSIAYALSLPNEAAVAEVLVNSRFEPMF